MGLCTALSNWDSLNWLDFTDVEEEKVMQVAPGRNVRIPFVDIRVDCEVVSGTIRCGYFRTVPPGVDLIIGNDLVTVEEPSKRSISTPVVKIVEENGIDAVDVRNVTCTKFDVETKKSVECTNDLNDGDLPLMFDDSDENGRMISDSVSGDDIIQIQSRMNADEKAATIDKQVLVQPDVCKDECTRVINDSGSRVDIGLTELSRDSADIGVNCAESQVCEKVYFRDVSATELLVAEERQPRQPFRRTGSRRGTAFVALWMTMTVLALSTHDTSVMTCTAYVGPPSTEKNDAVVRFRYVRWCGTVGSVTDGIL